MTMTTDLPVPQPPSWISLDPIVHHGMRSYAFRLAHELGNAPGDTLVTSTLEEARELLQYIDQRTSEAAEQIDSSGCLFSTAVSDGLGYVLTNYTGSASLHVAMAEYVERCIHIDVARYHPEEFMRPAVIAADA